MNEETQFEIIEFQNHKIWLKNSITWGDQKRINAPLFAGSKIKINPVTNQPESIEADANVSEKMQEQEILVLIHKIEDKMGKALNVNITTLEQLQFPEYESLALRVKEIYEEIKKKSSKMLETSTT